jgi:hypothetical protein
MFTLSEDVMRKFKSEYGNWTDYKHRFNLSPSDVVDFHSLEKPKQPHYELMAEYERDVERALKRAQQSGRPYMMFTHGLSSSKPGRTTARTVVRGFMRSKAATPYIMRAECIQHPSVFIAKIRAVPPSAGEFDPDRPIDEPSMA